MTTEEDGGANGGRTADAADGGSDFGVEDFVARCKTTNPSTLATYRKRLRTAETLHGRPLGQATARSLGTLKEKLRDMRSGRSYAKDLHAFYVKMGKPELAVLCHLQQRVAKLDQTDLLGLEDVNALLAACTMQRDRAILATLWATGQRIDAVLSLRLRDLTEMKEGDGGPGIRVFFWKTKVNGAQHVGYIADEEGASHVRAWLRSYPYARLPNAPAFPSHDGKRLEPDSFRDILPAIARRAGVVKPHLSPHLFRHSRATFLLQNGVPSHSVRLLLGWGASSNVLERTYAHLISKDARNDLMKSLGRPITRTVDPARLAAAEGDLQPVVPMLEHMDPKASPLEAEMQRLRSELETLRRGFDVMASNVALRAGVPPGTTVNVDVAEEGPKAVLLTAKMPDGAHRQIGLQEPGSGAIIREAATTTMTKGKRGKA